MAPMTASTWPSAAATAWQNSGPHVAIVGAGAIGGWVGARLALAGARVSVLARGATLTQLHAHGLTLHQGGNLHHAPVAAFEHAAQLVADGGLPDLIVLSLKAPAVAAVAPSLQPLLGAHTVVLSAMNGVPWWFFDGFGGALAGTRLSSVDAGGVIAAALPAAHIVGCVVHASASTDAPAVVRHHFGTKLIIGEPTGAASTRVQALAALLQRAGFEAPVSPQIQRDVWYKLWGNMTMNPISALTGATTDRVLADDLVRAFIGRVMLEARTIGERIGIPIDQTPEDRHAVTAKLGAFKTSMLQDVQAGRPVEVDALVAAVRELGQLTGVPTPETDTLLGLSRLHARTLGLY
jgi:2-dehydropantoate 2-reductase